MSRMSAGVRVVPLQGGQNFRDLGGYKGAGDRTVRWQAIYRSGSMHGLTPEDFATLKSLGIATVVDFRSTAEHRREPVIWPSSYAPNYVTEDYSFEMGELSRILKIPGTNCESASVAFADFYRTLPFQFAGQYRRMIAELLSENTPLVFNCSAGKDRTGVAAALVLTILGVSREDVIEDYLLSNRYYQRGRSANGIDVGMKDNFDGPSSEVVRVLEGTDRRYLEAAFAAIDAHPGGLEAYSSNELGLSIDDVHKLQLRYLE